MQVINKKDYVKRKIATESFKMVSSYVLIGAGFFVVAMGFVYHWLFVPVGSILFIFGGMILVNRSGEVSIWKAGLKGQQTLPKALQDLPDEYSLINNVSLKDRSCDIDHVIVCPKGLFAIESKHYNGEVFGQGDEWGYLKRGRAGGFYKGHIGNPAKQIKRNVWELKQRLDQILGQRGIDPSGVWIEPIVVFTNPNTILKITEPAITAIKLDSLYNFLVKYEAKTPIGPELAKTIAEILKQE